ncbi:helix-turn-helix transcriptional regulator (plasmid) [Rhizobium leguminosarum]|nr:helix-turn-helix transcriptional regulator [Rhizobium leguminosarum]
MNVPTAALKKAREAANINQTEMAKRLGVSSNSVVSRLENSETTDQAMAERYLKAIGTEQSLAMLDYYSREWKITKRPDYRHPNRDPLWQAETALQSLDTFESGEFDALLREPLNFLRNNLISTADYVWQTDHALAWIGVVGIGKTTALSHLTNLILSGSDGRPRPIFPASGGRTTTSEVVVRPGPAFGVAVEPKTEDEIRILVGEIVDAAVDGKGGVSTEIDRAIRNMAGLPKGRDPNDPKILIDPIKDLIGERPESREDVVHSIVSRMKLEQRTETQLLLSENDTGGLEWLSKVVTDINFGRHSRFSLPQRVTVFVPKSAMRKSAFDLTIIDTKGIHGATDRRDLQAMYINPRTLNILCCAFNDAPGQETLNILKGLLDTGSDAIERHRVMLLVLPRADEALKVINDMGDQVESVAEGYAYRTAQILDSLKAENIPPIPILYFNAIEDGSATTWREISRNIDVLRQRQLDRLSRFTTLALDFHNNADAHKIQQARVTLAKEGQNMWNDYPALATAVRAAHKGLITELQRSHPSTIAAAVVRKGSWYNLDIHHLIGTGIRADANLRTSGVIKKIQGRLDALRSQFGSTSEALALVDTLAEDLADWHQDFLVRAVTIGKNAFRPYLDADVVFWKELKRRWGQGSGYRNEIGEMMEKWFEKEELNKARAKIDRRLEEAWKELVLDRILERSSLKEAAED